MNDGLVSSINELVKNNTKKNEDIAIYINELIARNEELEYKLLVWQ